MTLSFSEGESKAILEKYGLWREAEPPQPLTLSGFGKMFAATFARPEPSYPIVETVNLLPPMHDVLLHDLLPLPDPFEEPPPRTVEALVRVPWRPPSLAEVRAQHCRDIDSWWRGALDAAAVPPPNRLGMQFRLYPQISSAMVPPDYGGASPAQRKSTSPQAPARTRAAVDRRYKMI